MVADGVLDGVDEVYGLHLLNTLETGTIGVKAGPLMAAPDKFTCQVVGKGGHGAMPQHSIDAMATSSHILTALQTVVSRSVDPLESAVVTVGKMENEEGSTTCGCGHTFNVICGKVVMHGTSRSFNDKTQALLRRRITEVTSGVASALGASASTAFDDVNYGYPAVVNDDDQAALADKAARAVVGEGNVKAGTGIMTMAGEDFSYYLRERPGCFVFVGSRPPGTTIKPHHHPSFDIDEEALPVGAAFYVRLVEDLLG